MKTSRLEAFSDGVIAIIITIMVLELKVPHGAGWSDLAGLTPVFLSYVLSFIYVAIYWNNHHHMVDSTHRVTGWVLWANHALLFCLTLFPLMIRWIDEAGVTPWPVASFGVVLSLASLAYRALQFALSAAEGEGSRIREVMRRPLKEYSSLALYILAIVLAFFQPYLSVAIYVFAAALWIIPDRRFVRPAT